MVNNEAWLGVRETKEKEGKRGDEERMHAERLQGVFLGGGGEGRFCREVV